jgi:hypothetical protein
MENKFHKDYTSLQNLIEVLYNYHCTGGSLHIVTDDYNLEDHSLDFCRQELKTNSLSLNDPPWLIKAQEAILDLLGSYEGKERYNLVGVGSLYEEDQEEM